MFSKPKEFIQRLGNPKENTSLKGNVVASEGRHIEAPEMMTGETMKLALEAFDGTENLNNVYYNIAVNITASKQDDFAEAFFPTVVIHPEEVGVSYTVALTSFINDYLRNAAGDPVNGQGQSVIKNIYNTDENSDSWQNNLFDGIYFLYLTQYNVDLTEVSNQLNQVGEEITSAYGDLGASLFDTVNEVADDKLSSLAYEDGKERSLAVLYLPVLVHAYTALEDKSGDAKETIRTFVLVPVYYEVVYATNGNLDANDKLSGYKKVDIASSSSLIDDYKE